MSNHLRTLRRANQQPFEKKRARYALRYPTATDPRIAYGAHCTWWDTIAEVDVSPASGLPLCPGCGGVLMEVPTETKWWAAVVDRPFTEWCRGRCFTDPEQAREAYELETNPPTEELHHG